MTQKDYARFGTTIALLGEQYHEPLSEARIALLFTSLVDLPIDDVERAARLYLNTANEFFPTPGKLRLLLVGNVKDQALAAFERIREAVRATGYYGTPRLDAADMAMVQAVWGGWQRCCETLPAPGSDTYAWELKRFVDAYGAAADLLLPAPTTASRADAARLVNDLHKKQLAKVK